MIVHHSFSVEEWHRMGEVGLFGEETRMELLDGEIIDMAPIGSHHAGTVNRLTELLVTALSKRGVVAVQNPVLLDKRSEPQPDLAVLARRGDHYSLAHAEPSEILLLVEVADSTLVYDRDRKAPYYAKSGVRECWIIDLTGDQVLVMRSPAAGGYEDVRALHRGGNVDIEALAGIDLEVDGILGARPDDRATTS